MRPPQPTDTGETRAEIARRRLAQLAASFEAEISPERLDDVPVVAPRRVRGAHVRVLVTIAVAAGWDWAAVEHQETSGVRWVQGVAMRATYDAESQTVTQVGALLDLAAITLPAIEHPTGDLDEATIAAVQEDLMTLDRPDVLGHFGLDGIVVLQVLYDDGSMQAAVDDIYGEGVVSLESALR